MKSSPPFIVSGFMNVSPKLTGNQSCHHFHFNLNDKEMELKYIRFCVGVFKLSFALSMVATCPIWFFAKLCFDYDIVEETTALFNDLDELVGFYYK